MKKQYHLVKSANPRSQQLEDKLQGQGRKQGSQEMRQARIGTVSWGDDCFDATDPENRDPFPPGTHCHHLKGVICGVWSEELFSTNNKSCFVKRCNEKVQIIIKVQTQGRTHSEKKTQKCQHLCYLNQLLHCTQEGV